MLKENYQPLLVRLGHLRLVPSLASGILLLTAILMAGLFGLVMGQTAYAATATSSPVAPVLNAISNPGGTGTYIVAWGAVSNTITYTLQEDNNFTFTAPITLYSGSAISVALNGKPIGTYYYRVEASNDTGDSDWSNVVSATVRSPVNGDFENGTLGWMQYSSHGWQNIWSTLSRGFPRGLPAHSGHWLAWLGGGNYETANISQQVTVPITSTGASYLSYWLWMVSGDICGYDFGGVSINATVLVSDTLCKTTNTGGWVQHILDLSAYAGQPVTLVMWLKTDRSYPSSLFIDDVAFQTSPLASPPQPPALNSINNPGGIGNYVVTWRATSGAITYTLQEDINISFTAPITLYSGTGISWSVAGKPIGTYFYRVKASNAAGDSDWSNIRSVSVQLPINGDFESGLVGWTQYSIHGWQNIWNTSRYGFPIGVTAHSGSWVAWLGGGNKEKASISQQVTVPTSTAYLAYWYWTVSSDSCGYDFGGVYVNGALLDSLTLCAATNTGGWVQHVLDLSAYAGQPITLELWIKTDVSYASSLFFDDVGFQSDPPVAMSLAALATKEQFMIYLPSISFQSSTEPKLSQSALERADTTVPRKDVIVSTGP